MNVGYKAVTADVDSGFRQLAGWQFTETAGAAARVLLRDGSSSGAILVDVKLAAGESVGENYVHPIVLAGAAKVYVDVDTGAVRGAVYGA